MHPTKQALTVRQFQEWLNERRNLNVSAIFHETVAQYRTALSSAAPAAGEVAGLTVWQEPKYTVSGSAIINRASGEPIPADEPVFIFRARDWHAVNILAQYAREVRDPNHAAAVWGRVGDFKRFQDEKPGRMKAPDTAVTPPAPSATSAACGTCNDHGSVGRPPDDYFPCPDCTPAPAVMDEKAEREAFEADYRKRYGHDDDFRSVCESEWRGWKARATIPAAQPEAETSAEKAADESKPRNKADIRRVLTEWNDVTGALPDGGSWFYEVEGMMEDAFDCGAAQADAPVAEPVALTDEQHEKEMLAVIDERDKREEVINAILDEVLGLDRHEWSSAYGFADAVEDVKTRMHAIEREHSGLESEIEDLRAESWPDWANQVLKIVRAQSGYDGYDDADGVDIPGEVQELADEYSRTFKAMETYRKERDEARAGRPPAPEEGKDAVRKPLTEEQVKAICYAGPVHAPSGVVERSPSVYRQELEAARLHGFRAAEKAHGITDAALSQGGGS
jgi:hypothetical protein